MFSLEELAGVFGKDSIKGAFNGINITSVEHDTRRIKSNSLYVAIKGSNLDGHDFVKEAKQKGSVACLVHRHIDDAQIPQIVVKDTIEAYGKIASYWRSKINYPLIAITGSNGKTTTKDMLYSILSFKHRTVRTDGNFNNLIGAPYTLLSFPIDAEFGIVEMGMNSHGEIKKLSDIARPNIGLITNIGRAHIGLLGTIEGIFNAKMELFDHIIKNSGSVCVNMSDPMISKWFTAKRPSTASFTYSTDETEAELMVRSLGFSEGSEHFEAFLKGAKPLKGSIPVMGIHNVHNAASAIALGLMAGMDLKDCIEGIKDFKASKLRSSILEKNGVIYFVDCYNANPDSMKAAILSTAEYRTSGKKIAVLGDMLELESMSGVLHKEIGSFTASKGFDSVFAYGNYSQEYAEGFLGSGGKASNIHVYSLGDMLKMKRDLNSVVNKGDIVVVKGSRGMKLEEIFQD